VLFYGDNVCPVFIWLLLLNAHNFLKKSWNFSLFSIKGDSLGIFCKFCILLEINSSILTFSGKTTNVAPPNVSFPDDFSIYKLIYGISSWASFGLFSIGFSGGTVFFLRSRIKLDINSLILIYCLIGVTSDAYLFFVSYFLLDVLFDIISISGTSGSFTALEWFNLSSLTGALRLRYFCKSMI